MSQDIGVAICGKQKSQCLSVEEKRGSCRFHQRISEESMLN